MNKELIKANMDTFNHWLNGESILSINCIDTLEWTEVNHEDHWNTPITSYYKPMFVINDEYVEFRKALAEGKTIQCKETIKLVKDWVDVESINPIYGECMYRIKPEEPEFTYPMWFKSLSTAEVWKFTAITQGHRIDDELYRTHKPHTDKAIWTQIPEPTSVIKIAKYAYSTSNIEWIESNRFFKTDEDFLSKYYIEAKFKAFKFKRLTEIEVEEY